MPNEILKTTRFMDLHPSSRLKQCIYRPSLPPSLHSISRSLSLHDHKNSKIMMANKKGKRSLASFMQKEKISMIKRWQTKHSFWWHLPLEECYTVWLVVRDRSYAISNMHLAFMMTVDVRRVPFFLCCTSAMCNSRGGCQGNRCHDSCQYSWRLACYKDDLADCHSERSREERRDKEMQQNTHVPTVSNQSQIKSTAFWEDSFWAKFCTVLHVFEMQSQNAPQQAW